MNVRRVMKKFFLLMVFVASLHVTSFSQGLTVDWALGEEGANFQQAKGIAADKTGNTYVTGFFNSTFLLNGFSLQGSQDVFLYKCNADGHVDWAKSAGGSAWDDVDAVACDGTGNVYIDGTSESDTMYIGPFSLSDSMYQFGYLAKYDSSGNVLWAKKMAHFTTINGISADAGNNLYLTGSFSENYASLGDTSFTLPPGRIIGADCYFLAKCNELGTVVWIKYASYQGGSVEGLLVRQGDQGSTYVTGTFRNKFIVLGNDTLHNSGLSDIFIAKYDSTGQLLWCKSIGGDRDDEPTSMAADLAGNLYVTGYSSGDTLNFGSQLLYPGSDTSIQFKDFFLARYSSTGNLIWVKGGQGNSFQNNYAVATDQDTHVYLTGGFVSGSPEFFFDSISLLPPQFFKDPMFVLTLDSNGNELCSTSLGSGGESLLYICSGSPGTATIAGTYDSNPFVIGNSSLPLTGMDNAFTVKLSCDKATAIESVEESSTSLLLHPNPFTAQATVQYSLPGDFKNASLQIYDVLGRLRNSYPINNSNGEISMNANNLSAGVYLYSLVINNRVLVTEKMVVE